MWVFGYGSLTWKVGFDYLDRRVGYIEGFARRFWQGSYDHRGVPGAPGRVVTLVERGPATCWGVAYRLAEHGVEEVLDRLDYREKGGYERHHVPVLHGGEVIVDDALVYIATPGNPNYLGPAEVDHIAEQILSSSGPSGDNTEYLLELAEALRDMGAEDEHVFELEEALRRLLHPA